MVQASPYQTLVTTCFLAQLVQHRSVHVISCKEKALLVFSLALSPGAKQALVLCKIDSGAETKIIPTVKSRIELIPHLIIVH